VDRRFRWKYPFEEATDTPSKVSVTYLKSLKTGMETTVKIPELIEYPEFLKQKESYTSSERGTLNHRLLELIPFDREWEKSSLMSYIEELLERGAILEEELEHIDCDGILQFLTGDIYKRILSSKKVRKEQPFVYVKREPREMYIQGIVDCYFEEEGELVIVDYKTDRVENDSELISRYSEQLGLYREALESVTKKSVKNSYIYSLYTRREIEV
jgi:ATP-dependent helicase/nuclease subunit A